MPFMCEACGGYSPLMSIADQDLECGHCGARRGFARPPLMVIAGAAGAGKSTLCQRLAGTIPGIVALDADTFIHDLTAVTPPRRDYPAFWRFLMRLAHEIAQSGQIVVYFGVTVPDQVLANPDMADYFDGVRFLGLVCEEGDLRARLTARAGADTSAARADLYVAINRQLREVASTTPNMTVVDGSRSRGEVESDVRKWIIEQVESLR